MSELSPAVVWPLSRAQDAVAALAQARRIGSRAAPALDSSADVDIDSAALTFGLEAEPIEARYGEIETLLAQARGVIVQVEIGAESGLILIVKGGRSRLRVLTPSLEQRRVSGRAIRDVLRAPVERKLEPTLAALLTALPSARHAQARNALLHSHLAGVSIFVGWLLRTSPAEPFLAQLCEVGLRRHAVRLMSAHALAYVLWIGAWWLIGVAALEGRYDPGWWQAWVMLLISLAGLQMLSSWWQTQFLTSAAACFKRRLLYGALRLDPDHVRREGAGQLLGRVLDAEAIEGLALNGGLSAVLAVFEIAMSLFVLVNGAGGGSHAVLLLFWLGLAALITWRYIHFRRRWTGPRLTLTHHLTEQMVGHRTRLAQQPKTQWHDGEDAALSHYNDVSKTMDQWAVMLTTLVPRGWLMVSLIALAPAWLAGSPASALGVGLGGGLLAYAALRKCTQGLLQLAAANIAWEHVAPVFHAGKAMSLAKQRPPAAHCAATVFMARDVVFRYRKQGPPLLRGIDLDVLRGERILIEGASGGGKSTLANIITGLRVADSGLVLLNGADRHTWGDTWRKHAVSVPQFHENHIMSESLAFNLLMGRNWPPAPADLVEAEAMCRRLGLGELIERMPSGLWQTIGENGWRLSHGERSRVYLARALLQSASLMVFDESFAALDPENLARAMDCVIAHAPSLIVIAHH